MELEEIYKYIRENKEIQEVIKEILTGKGTIEFSYEYGKIKTKMKKTKF
ncbi:hypothetical protein [Sebaldella sp. S0638]|nr:hypothetical protein [Sebaldella sp. S0638]MCP1226477.1 hypothetical protein [Sebaldella sp. S0638]